MKSSRVFVITICAMLMGGAAFGQRVVQLQDESEFDGDRISLTFTQFQEGALARDLLTAYGVRIEAIGGGTPTIGRDLVVGQAAGFVSNQAEPAEGLNTQLIFDFQYPVRQFGLLLRHAGTSTIDARMQFHNLRGDNIATFQFPVEPGIGPLAAFEATQDEAFSRVVLNYGVSPFPEQFFQILLTYQERPVFTSYVAQVGDGALPGGGGLRTNIYIANLSNTIATGQLLLFGDDGSPLELTLGGETASAFDLNLLARSVAVFPSSGTSSPPVQGYACVESDQPLSVTGIFQILNAEGRPTSEAGVEGTRARHQVLSTVVREQGVGLDSGIAAANPSDQTANAQALLLDRNGGVVDTNNEFLQLGPGEHTAGFLPQIFPGVSADFEGTLLIVSDQALAVVVLRTGQGLVLSSLPSGSLEP